ncbi:MAG: biopolymer transporter ExbD [Planctomycetia bacterium]|nr:biopolymer transporter ExbD [Planctomycetia bacterium]
MAERRSVAAPEKVDVQMTPLIDIVFQLMAFFLMTFKVAAVEGDFRLKLPAADRTPSLHERPDVIDLRLRADPAGNLAELRYASDAQAGASSDAQAGGKPSAASFRRLSEFVARRVAQAHAAGQAEPAVLIHADDLLCYEYVLDAVAAVSATTDADGNYRRLVKQVSFAPRAK